MKFQSILRWLAVAVGVGALSARAASVSLLDLAPGDRNVVAVVDVQQLFASKPAQALGRAGLLAELDQKFGELEQFTGFNLRRDLQRVMSVKFGGANPQELVVLEGAFNESQILGVLRMNPQYATATYGETTLHSWFDDKERKQKSGAFLASNLIVIGPEQGVKDVIDLRATPAKSFGQRPEVQRAVAGLSVEPVFYAVGRDVGNPAFAKLPTLLVTIDVQAGFTLKLAAETADEKTAQHLRDLVNGLVALGRLSNKAESKLLAENATIQANGKTVTAIATVPDEQFTAWLLQAAKAKKGGQS